LSKTVRNDACVAAESSMPSTARMAKRLTLVKGWHIQISLSLGCSLAGLPPAYKSSDDHNGYSGRRENMGHWRFSKFADQEINAVLGQINDHPGSK
jgi:hypothetical protein